MQYAEAINALVTKATGPTVQGYHQCCPGVTYCKSGVCCTSSDDCSVDVNNSPRCANETWSLYSNDNDKGYFCCGSGFEGRNVEGGVGCQSNEKGATLISPASSNFLSLHYLVCS